MFFKVAVSQKVKSVEKERENLKVLFVFLRLKIDRIWLEMPSYSNNVWKEELKVVES